MAIPRAKESPRAIYPRDLADKVGSEEMMSWPGPTRSDYALFGRIIHIYSAIDFALRFAAELMDEQKLLRTKWAGRVQKPNMTEVSKAIQEWPAWLENHRIGCGNIELHRPVRNLVAHFVARRFPNDDAFLFLTKSASDYKQVHGDLPPVENALFGVMDAMQLRDLVPELLRLNKWCGTLPGSLSNPIVVTEPDAKADRRSRRGSRNPWRASRIPRCRRCSGWRRSR